MAAQQCLQVVESGQGLKGGEGIDAEVEQLVADLAEQRVVELKD